MPASHQQQLKPLISSQQQPSQNLDFPLLCALGNQFNTSEFVANLKSPRKIGLIFFEYIDPTLFYATPKIGKFGDRFVIFSGGKLEYRKGQDIVIAAFKVFHRRHPDALLLTMWHNFWPQFMRGLEQAGHVVGVPAVATNGTLQLKQWLLHNGIPGDAVVDVGLIPNYQIAQLLREVDVAVFTETEGKGEPTWWRWNVWLVVFPPYYQPIQAI